MRIPVPPEMPPLRAERAAEPRLLRRRSRSHPAQQQSPPAPLQLARPAAEMGAAGSSQSKRSARSKCPGSSAPHAHTRRSPPTPQQLPRASTSALCQQRTPHLSGRHRPRSRVPAPARSRQLSPIPHSAPFSRSCPALPVSHNCFGQRQILPGRFLHIPMPNLPVALIRHRRQVPARIHHMRVSHCCKHRAGRAVCFRTRANLAAQSGAPAQCASPRETFLLHTSLLPANAPSTFPLVLPSASHTPAPGWQLPGIPIRIPERALPFAPAAPASR